MAAAVVAPEGGVDRTRATGPVLAMLPAGTAATQLLLLLPLSTWA